LIIATNLTKKFGSHLALDNLNLNIQKGECFGLLGPNGAGKSTFITLLYASSLKTSGTLSVFGLNPEKNQREVKKKLGVVTQENALDEALTVFENMMIYANFCGLKSNAAKKRIEDLLEYFSIAQKMDSPIRFLSGGMKRRLVFVRALLPKPELLILDEPTTGLDPAVRQLLWGKVKELNQQGTTILLTTHYMAEAENLCSRIVIMNKGKVLAEGSPQSLISEFCTEPPFLNEKPNLEDVFLKLTGSTLSGEA
jgi:lipooligosaccharide transport system ATP-binding protein